MRIPFSLTAFTFGKISLFIIYFWFGILKVLNISPAEALVNHLGEITIEYFINNSTFIFLFGIFECFIGLGFLFNKTLKIAFFALLLHMATTFLPMIFLPNDTWNSFLTPTLVGQYIIKNLAIISLSYYLFLNLKQKITE